MNNPTPLPARPLTIGRYWLRWFGMLLASIGLAMPVTAWLAGPDRWWSAFIFLPAYCMIGLALIHSRVGGQLSHWSMRSNLGLGAIVLTVALILALGLDWRYAWTLMLIVPGLVVAVNGFTRAPFGSAGFGFGAWITTAGVSIAVLGLVFLGHQLGTYNLSRIFGDFAWWSPLIMLPGLVALGCGWLTLSGRGSVSGGTCLMVIGSLHLATGLSEWINLAWQWEPPVLVAAAGAGLLLSALRHLGGRQATR
jgi:hypothetical protein